MRRTSIKRQFVATAVLIAMCGTLALTPIIYKPKTAYAIPAEIIGGIGTIQETISAVADVAASSSLFSLQFKEMVLDPIAWAVAKMIVKGIIRSTINWINSGFKGSPAYVTDLEGFLLDIVDREIGNYIYGTELGFLCSPFQLQIRLALALRFKGHRDRIMCRLSDIVNNVNNFIGRGDFMQGGWDAWFVMTVDDNPYNRYLEGANELDLRIVNARGQQLKLLEFGSGFFSWQDCKDISVQDGPPERKCTIATPGSYIKDQLSQVAGADVASLIEADEINELIGALAAQLVVQTLGGSSGGLRGVSQSYNNQPSYLDRMAIESITPQTQATSTEKNPLIAQENKYRAHVSSALDSVRQTQGFALQLNICSSDRGGAYVNTHLKGFIDELNSKIALTDQNIAQLRSIDVRQANSTNPSELTLIGRELENIISSGVLHDTGEIAQEQLRKNDIASAMTQHNSRIQQELALCQSQNNAGQSGNGGGGDGGAGGAGGGT